MMNRGVQIVVLVVAAAVIIGGALVIAGHRTRAGLVMMTLGVLFAAVIVIFNVAGGGRSSLANAPGRGSTVPGQTALYHEAVPGVAGAASYELDLYGTDADPAAVVESFGQVLQPYGYHEVPLTAGPILNHGNAVALAQWDRDTWRWRAYELPLPTRFAGRNYDARDFAHLVVIMLSDDGK
jgi:hypothetical protein